MPHSLRMPGQLFRTVAIAACLLAAFAVVAQACNVPVFRFALERWRASPYRATVFHRGPLSDADRKAVIEWEKQHDQTLANLQVRTVDLDEQDEVEETDRALLASQDDPQLPWVVVQYPADFRNEVPVWSGPLKGESLAHLTQSPVRKELIRRLANGQTAVWLLLETGDAAKDAAAAATLEKEIARLDESLTLPELTDSPDDQVVSQAPLHIEFSMLRVRRDDPAEQALVAMLVTSEADLKDRTDDPMIFPVFGRGRALLPLIGAGITAENIADSATFLVGPCSCEVKELNPGFDLLLAAEWDTLLFEEGVEPPAIVESLPPDAEPVMVPIPSGSKPVPETKTVKANPAESPVVAKPDTSRTSNGQVAGYALAGLVLAALVLAAVRLPKRVE